MGGVRGLEKGACLCGVRDRGGELWRIRKTLNVLLLGRRLTIAGVQGSLDLTDLRKSFSKVSLGVRPLCKASLAK